MRDFDPRDFTPLKRDDRRPDMGRGGQGENAACGLERATREPRDVTVRHVGLPTGPRREPLRVRDRAALLDAALTVDSEEHKWAGASMHDRIIGALETCCRKGEMLRIQGRHVDWERFQIAIPGANAKDSENRRVPFEPRRIVRQLSVAPDLALPEGRCEKSRKRRSWLAIRSTDKGLWDPS